MKKRILGGAIVLIVLITSILLGDIPFAITISLVALLGLKELIDIKYKNKDIKAIKILSSISMLLILLNNTLYTLDIKVLIYLPILILILPVVFYNNKEKYNINYNIEIVAVSKYASLENIKEFLNLNLDLPLAESKAQSLRDRVGELEKFNKNLNIKWHFIGRIQSNKIKYIVKFSDLIQSVDSVEIAELIDKEAQKNNKIQNILLQFNISFENQKGGFNLSDYKNIYEQILKMTNIKIKGLMGIASNSEEKNLIENEFEKLNKIFKDINLEFDKNKISILSMGMTSDYELAIKHGSNMIRIGSGLLGNS